MWKEIILVLFMLLVKGFKMEIEELKKEIIELKKLNNKLDSETSFVSLHYSFI